MIWFDDRKGRRKNYVVLRYIWGRSYWAMTWQYDRQLMMHNGCMISDVVLLILQYSIYLLSFSRWRWFQSWMNQSNQSWSSFNSWIANIFFVIIRVLREAYIAFQNTCNCKRRKDFICSFYINSRRALQINQSFQHNEVYVRTLVHVVFFC